MLSRDREIIRPSSTISSRETLRQRVKSRVAERRGNMMCWVLALLLILTFGFLASENANQRIDFVTRQDL